MPFEVAKALDEICESYDVLIARPRGLVRLTLYKDGVKMGSYVGPSLPRLVARAWAGERYDEE